MALAFRAIPMDAEPAAALVDALRAELRALSDDLDVDAPHMPAAGPREFDPPRGTFLVGFDATGAPVCCGGVKPLGGGACELKRMYVVPERRGAGAGRELLAALEDAARSLGHAVARLDTGPRQPRAERMWRRAGYRPIGNFNDNPMASFWGEKPL
jgi:GNAT superfamily N-acetyltransferase